jgi:pyruvate/2-oxoglutarate dehydrogenase complex dihydrolipoamide acyltransferase (E2) component
MHRRYLTMGAILGTLAVQSYSAQALTMHECSVKYRAAKEAGTLNGMKWNEFRRAQCGAEATAAPATAPPPAAAPYPAPSAALTIHECSVKYRAAKEAGTLNGMKWNEFRRAQCGAEATAAPATAPPPAAAPYPAPSAAPVTVGNAVFPSAVSPKYSRMSAGRARFETCLDQYRANKANNGNGGLRWIQRGDGYYSECNKRLKGQA